MRMLPDLTLLDALGLTLLIGGWLFMGWIIERPNAKTSSVSMLMQQQRRDWMEAMSRRSQRIFDATTLSILRQGTTFFASTLVIGIGGILALIGNADRVGGIAAGLGLRASVLTFQIKLALVGVLLVVSFLKFVWANRLFGYCAVVMGAVPNIEDEDATRGQIKHRAAQAADLNIRAAANFNRGLRAMYVALAAMAWLLGAPALIAASLSVLWVIWSREYRSKPHEILSRTVDEPAEREDTPGPAI